VGRHHRAQLVVALRRRALLGNQWPMLIAGGVCIIAGLAYVIAATRPRPPLDMPVLYAAAGGRTSWPRPGCSRGDRRHLATLPARF
jgi:hypothetical protein